MGIIQERIKDDFNRLRKTRDIETFIVSMSRNYNWDWHNDIARKEIKEQLNKLRKEGFVWRLNKRQ